jgi:N-acetylmuramoyl-L-alanine amidase
MNRRGSPNFDDRPEGIPVDMLVLHYTGMRTAEDALARLCDAAAKVSAHYAIDVDGAVTALVDEGKRAWHAGVSFWRGHTDINARSIGIELVNPGHEYGYVDFADAQMTALIDLAGDIGTRHPIEARNVVGHSDVAPRRKTDPGERFDWKRLAEAGVGLWPERAAPAERFDDTTVAALLAAYGYAVEDTPAAVTAFQRHFRPDRCDGAADAETAGLLEALLRRVA